jgi:GAF domain-containing protein
VGQEAETVPDETPRLTTVAGEAPASGDPAAAFAELSTIMLGAQPLTATLERVAALAAGVIPGADEVSVTLMDGDRARTVAFTGSLAVVLDERQYDAGFGPCMDAAITGTTVAIDDTSTDERYPHFSRLAGQHGIRHTLAVGMRTPQRTIGALNVYGSSADVFDEDARRLAATFAGYAAVSLANAALYTSTAELAAQMQHAMESRAVIEQAKGILMRDNRCSPDEAFAMLVRASNTANRKLRDIAQSLVESAQEGR